MRSILKLVLTFVLVMTAVFIASSIWQVNSERHRLASELTRQTVVFSDSFGAVIRPLLSEQLWDRLQPLADEFSKRENLIGVAILSEAGEPLAVSKAVAAEFASTESLSSLVTDPKASHDKFLELSGGKEIYVRVVKIDAGSRVFYLGVFHGTGFINQRLHRIWAMNFFRMSVLTLIMTGTALLIFYLSVWSPIQKTAEWMKRVRLGEVLGERSGPAPTALMEPLTKEVAKMAESLARARQTAEAEARLRQSSDSLWTPERLKEFVRVKLEGRQLFVVSNREPYQHVRKGKEIDCVVPASGLVTAIEPILKACGGTWVAEGNGDADRETVDASDRLRVPPEEPQYTLRRVWLTKEEEEGYYYGFSNEGLWPLCHIAHTRPIFRSQDWLAYEAVNRKFAKALLEELEGTQEPCVLIQDYHFALLPALIKAARPDARVTIFWHIPWPNPESFGICPWQNELLKGMLGADIIGFHTQYHCNNFLQTVDRFLESRIDYEHFTVNREGQTTWVKPFPISIAFVGGDAVTWVNGESEVTLKDQLLASYGLTASRMGVGVDRIDYTKGILERFRSVEAFLETHAEFIGEFTFVELGAPSRTLIPKYQEFMTEVEREVDRINGRFKSKKNWKPILFLKKHHSQKEILPYYRAADLCMVTSLHDGMNLVAKEFVTARGDDTGVLILSQFTGAARELKDALIINPYDIAQAADAIRRALAMPLPEQKDRMRRMRAYIKERNIYRWAADIVNELADVRIETYASHKGIL